PAAGSRPLRHGVLDREVDKLAGSVLARETALGLDRLAKLPVQRLDRVGRVDHATHFRLEAEEGDHVLPAVAPGLADHRQSLTPFLLARLERGVSVDRRVDRPQVFDDLVVVATRDVAEALPDQVHDAGLHSRGWEDRLDRFREALQSVDAADQDVADAAGL